MCSAVKHQTAMGTLKASCRPSSEGSEGRAGGGRQLPGTPSPAVGGPCRGRPRRAASASPRTSRRSTAGRHVRDERLQQPAPLPALDQQADHQAEEPADQVGAHLLRREIRQRDHGDVVDVDAPTVAVERPGDGRSVLCPRRSCRRESGRKRMSYGMSATQFSATSASSAGRAATNASNRRRSSLAGRTRRRLRGRTPLVEPVIA